MDFQFIPGSLGSLVSQKFPISKSTRFRYLLNDEIDIYVQEDLHIFCCVSGFSGACGD